MGSSQTRGCRFPGANTLVARVAGDPLVLLIGDGLLIEREYGIKLSVRGVGNYLSRWGFTQSSQLKG
jgi:hypothetical protein